MPVKKRSYRETKSVLVTILLPQCGVSEAIINGTIIPWTGGATTSKSTGYWRNDDGDVILDNVLKVETLATPSEALLLRSQYAEWAHDLGEIELCAWEIEVTPYFIRQ